jgi:hypothetical protein
MNEDVPQFFQKFTEYKVELDRHKVQEDYFRQTGHVKSYEDVLQNDQDGDKNTTSQPKTDINSDLPS